MLDTMNIDTTINTNTSHMYDTVTSSQPSLTPLPSKDMCPTEQEIVTVTSDHITTIDDSDKVIPDIIADHKDNLPDIVSGIPVMKCPVADLVCSAEQVNAVAPNSEINLVQNFVKENIPVTNVNTSKDKLVSNTLVKMPNGPIQSVLVSVPNTSTSPSAKVPMSRNRKRKVVNIEGCESNISYLPDLVTCTLAPRSQERARSSLVPQQQLRQPSALTELSQTWRATGRSLKTIADNLSREQSQSSQTRRSSSTITASLVNFGSNLPGLNSLPSLTATDTTDEAATDSIAATDQVDGPRSQRSNHLRGGYESRRSVTSFTDLSVSLLFNFALYVTIRKLKNVIM
jgi:hypothetical protein